MIELHAEIDPKGLKETLCVAQSLRDLLPLNVNVEAYVRHLQILINECDRHRPVGPDGKHGDLHTETCGCEDGQIQSSDETEFAKMYRLVVGEEPPNLEENQVIETVERTGNGELRVMYEICNYASGEVRYLNFRQTLGNPRAFEPFALDGRRVD